MTQFTAEEIEYSRRLDVWKWGDFPEINDLVQNIFETYYADLHTRKDAIQRAKKHLKVLLIDLYVAFIDDPKLMIGLPMHPDAYSERSNWRSIHITSMIIGIVNRAVEVGLLEIWKGNEAQQRVSRIRPTETLRKLFKKSQLEPHYFDLQNSNRPPIVFRKEKDKTKRDRRKNYTPQEVPNLTKEDLSYLANSATIIIEYNAAIQHAYVDIPDLKERRLKVSKSGGKETYLRISQCHKNIYRVFNDFSIDSGGRFYGPFWQGMPEKDRERLYIDDEPTTELDYSGLHINLLYAVLGINKKYKGSDPYSINLSQYKITKDDARRLGKQLMLIALNAGNQNKAIAAFRDWLRKEEEDIAKCLPDLTNKTLKPIMAALEIKHPLIKDYFYSGFAKSLMTLDSMILEDIIEQSLEYGFIVLPVHDSIIVQRRHHPLAKQLMEDAFKKFVHKHIGVTVSSNSLGLGAFNPQNYQSRTKRYKASMTRWRTMKGLVPLPEKL
jgi:hypothetical protein